MDGAFPVGVTDEWGFSSWSYGMNGAFLIGKPYSSRNSN